MDLELLFQEMISTASVGAFVTGVLKKMAVGKWTSTTTQGILRDLP